MKINPIAENLQKNALENQNNYAKWLLASLVTVNGGAIIAISQISSSDYREFSISIALFFLGLVAALLSGASAWTNFTFAFVAYAFFTIQQDSIKGQTYFKKARFVGIAGIVFTVASIFAFAWGGFSVWQELRRPSSCLGLREGPAFQICRLFEPKR